MIIVFTGIPGSGKTTIATLLARKLKRYGKVRLFSSDRLKGRIYRRLGKLVRLWKDKTDYLIFDATFFKKRYRESVRKEAIGTPVFLIHLVCPIEICIRRNRKRRPNISERAINIITHKFEPVTKADLSINTARVKPTQAAKLIIKKIKPDYF